MEPLMSHTASRQPAARWHESNSVSTTHAVYAVYVVKAVWVAMVFCLSVAAPRPTWGQAGLRAIPHPEYFDGFGEFYNGDYKSARQIFRNGATSAYKTPAGQWVDSICYHAMLGECHYQMGDLANALDQFNAALNLFIANRDWMLRVQYPAAINQKVLGINTVITWGASERKSLLGDFPDHFQTLIGNVDNSAVVQTGGVVQQAQIFPISAAEIVRCTTLAIMRRADILGPAGKYDPLTMDVVNALSRRPTTPNHWSQCWIDLQLGAALAAAGKETEAVAAFSNSLVAGGTYDHPLTSLGLVGLGKIAFQQGKYADACGLFTEATYTAAYFKRYDMMEEAFRCGALSYLLSGQKGVYPPLVNAAAWAKGMSGPGRGVSLRSLHVSLATSLAEQLAAAGEPEAALVAINQGKLSINGAEMMLGAHGARLNYELAKASYQLGRPAVGAPALAAAMTYQKSASRWLYQIALTDQYIQKGAPWMTERIADELYSELLREPAPADWILDPLDTLAALTTPHPLPFEHWLELSLTPARRDQEKALQIADRIRRHRFFSSLTLGGRLHALRWVLEAPKQLLSDAALLQRQSLLAKYPVYAEQSVAAAKAKAALDALPLAPMEEAEKTKQGDLLGDLARASAAQEMILQTIALRREPAEFAFPPLKDTKEIQKSLPPGRLVLAYLVTTSNVYGFAVTRENYAVFTLASPARVKADVIEMLRKLNLHDRNQPVAADDLVNNDWKAPATRLLTQLSNEATAADWKSYKELVVVPDGVLWYVPFEALQIEQAAGSATLSSQLTVRYAPTAALSMPDGRGKRLLPHTAIAAGKMLPRDDEKTAPSAAEKIVEGVKGATKLIGSLPAVSSYFASAVDRLVVLADLDDSDKGPYHFAPFFFDRGRTGSTLADWQSLPFAGPEQVILPGFHTAAEYSLKRGGTGDEIFFTVCGLMSTGARTILLSRWRVGGETSFDLTREFTQELPHTPAAQAWQRSVRLLRETMIDFDHEPRVRKSSKIDSLKAEHPFFWAGYLLVDVDPDVPVVETKSDNKKGAKPPADPKKEAPKKEPDKKPAEKAEKKAPEKQPAEKKAIDKKPAAARSM